jgi:sugar lactone lactonase YvrE
MARDGTSQRQGLSHRRRLRRTRLLSGATISNGLGWSPAGERFHFVDSPTRRIDVFDHDPSSGAIANRRTLVAVEVPGAVPDGLKVDAEGCLWVVLHGGGQVRRYDPLGGLLEVVPLPVSRPTGCRFGGPGQRPVRHHTPRRLERERPRRAALAGALL